MSDARAWRDPALAQRLVEAIRHVAQGREPLRIMEFCGGHTHAILRYGIRQALAGAVRLLSGP
ncbi:MAG: hydrogenase formation protein HypD, partial [Chloroflexota bacterium]